VPVVAADTCCLFHDPFSITAIYSNSHTDDSVTKQYNLVPVAGQQCPNSYGWEGNRRSGVTLAMPHRLEWFIHLPVQGLSKGNEHPQWQVQLNKGSHTKKNQLVSSEKNK